MTPAARVAAWTRLRADRFGDQYTVARGARSAPSWNEVVALGHPKGSPRSVIQRGCQEAEKAGFLDHLCYLVTVLEAAEGRPSEDVEAIREAVPPSGLMQLVVDRARGFYNPVIFYNLMGAYEATAQVLENGQCVGTAFLVSPDLVLTAAHVAFQAEDQPAGRVFSRRLRDLRVRFPERPGEPTSEAARTFKLALRPLVASSPPDGVPPNQLNALTSASETRLDYALLRLSRQVTNIKALSIADPDAFLAHRLCFLIGYPGGSQAVFDASSVLDVPEAGGRAWHAVNTAPGMSGGCCVGEGGGVVGLHEGGVSFSETEVRNRAVTLRAIRRHMTGGTGRDPLRARPVAPGFAIYDPALVTGRWLVKGTELAAAAPWRAAADRLLASGIGSGTPALHPWFPRPDFERWADEALTRSTDRVCFVEGDRGVGKSFCLEILKAKLDAPELDLLRLSSTEVSGWTWREAIGKAVEITDAALVTRTRAGELRYDTVSELLDRLQAWGDGDREVSQRPLFLAIDCEAGADFGLDEADWLQFLYQAAGRTWLRLVVVGLSSDVQDRLENVLAGPDIEQVPVSVRLERFSEASVLAFGRTLRRQLSLPFTAADRDALHAAWALSQSDFGQYAELSAVEAVRVALQEVIRMGSEAQP